MLLHFGQRKILSVAKKAAIKSTPIQKQLPLTFYITHACTIKFSTLNSTVKSEKRFLNFFYDFFFSEIRLLSLIKRESWFFSSVSPLMNFGLNSKKIVYNVRLVTNVQMSIYLRAHKCIDMCATPLFSSRICCCLLSL